MTTAIQNDRMLLDAIGEAHRILSSINHYATELDKRVEVSAVLGNTGRESSSYAPGNPICIYDENYQRISVIQSKFPKHKPKED